ncbi:helix-turn-helix domain-containing protein [Cupriavidus basilensis]
MEMFCVAARTQSFTAAAVSLGTTPSALSARPYNGWRPGWDSRLFARTTRAVRLD